MDTLKMGLREWLTGHGYLKADKSYTSDEVKRAGSKAISEGKLELDEFTDLVAVDWKRQKASVKSLVREAIQDDDETDLEREANEYAARLLNEFNKGSKETKMSTVTPEQLFKSAAEAGDPQVRVRKTSERFSTTKSVGKHEKYGHDVKCRGQSVESLSELEYAKLGVFFRQFLIRTNPGDDTGIPPLKDYERDLYNEMVNSDEWSKYTEQDQTEDLVYKGRHVKTLLDDSTSGGQDIVPVEFDDAIITFPLLHGELMPYVDLRNAHRRLIEGASVGNVSVTWGSSEGTAFSLFNTNDLVNAINTEIHPVVFGVDVGRDFLADSPVEIGMELERRVGEKFMEEMDRVIAVGNGTDRPEGIFTSTGTTGVLATNSSTDGPLAIEDAINLYFGVPYQYRKLFGSHFLMNDTSYKRFRSLATGVTGDDRLLFGMDLGSYSLFDGQGRTHVRIQEDIANSQLAFCCLSKYRLYRRLGMSMRWHDEGKTLALANTRLLVMRARFGGRIMDGNAFAVMEDAQV